MKKIKSAALTAIPVDVKTIATEIAEGKLKNAKMEWNGDGSIAFSADSSDGRSRIILEKISYSGVTTESKTNISKPRNIEERLKMVEYLHKQGKTQIEIAKITMTSQKTVSNDIKKLTERGVLLEK